MSADIPNHLWQLLWEYDPNGLIVVDADLYVKLVNAAFCEMFQVQQQEVVGQPASLILGDVSDFKKVWQQDIVIRGKLREYPQHNLYVNEVIFSIEDEGIIACIMVDVSHDLERKREMDKLKQEAVRKVNDVVNKQMKVVQEIAGLLGETTAETKVSLWEIVQTFEKDTI